MAEETTETTTTEEPEGISEDELRGIFADEVKKELDARGLTAEVVEKVGGLGDFVSKLFEDNKGDGGEGLLDKIGTMIDEKLKGISSGNGGEKKEHTPKIKIF